MNILSISSHPYELCYAVFKGKTLSAYGSKEIFKDKTTSSRLITVKELVESLVKEHKIDIIVMNTSRNNTNATKDYIKTVEYTTTIHLIALLNGVIFSQFKTYGWEKRILMNIITKKRKVDTLNFGYELDLSVEQEFIADAIILGEGVAYNRLQIGVD